MKKYDVVGIGNAVVDIISSCDDGFLKQMGIEKGIMQLIDKDRSEFLYNSMGSRTNAHREPARLQCANRVEAVKRQTRTARRFTARKQHNEFINIRKIDHG